jgi:hypothetical protein
LAVVGSYLVRAGQTGRLARHVTFDTHHTFTSVSNLPSVSASYNDASFYLQIIHGGIYSQRSTIMQLEFHYATGSNVTPLAANFPRPVKANLLLAKKFLRILMLKNS